jgi:hypothetical protein
LNFGPYLWQAFHPARAALRRRRDHRTDKKNEQPSILEQRERFDRLAVFLRAPRPSVINRIRADHEKSEDGRDRKGTDKEENTAIRDEAAEQTHRYGGEDIAGGVESLVTTLAAIKQMMSNDSERNGTDCRNENAGCTANQDLGGRSDARLNVGEKKIQPVQTEQRAPRKRCRGLNRLRFLLNAPRISQHCACFAVARKPPNPIKKTAVSLTILSPVIIPGLHANRFSQSRSARLTPIEGRNHRDMPSLITASKIGMEAALQWQFQTSLKEGWVLVRTGTA